MPSGGKFNGIRGFCLLTGPLERNIPVVLTPALPCTAHALDDNVVGVSLFAVAVCLNAQGHNQRRLGRKHLRLRFQPAARAGDGHGWDQQRCLGKASCDAGVPFLSEISVKCELMHRHEVGYWQQGSWHSECPRDGLLLLARSAARGLNSLNGASALHHGSLLRRTNLALLISPDVSCI